MGRRGLVDPVEGVGTAHGDRAGLLRPDVRGAYAECAGVVALRAVAGIPGGVRGRPALPFGVPPDRRTADGVRGSALGLGSDLDHASAVAVTEPGCTSWGPVWNADGTCLAFFAAARDEGPVRLHVWEPATRTQRRASPAHVQARGFAADQPRWSADGRSVCVALVAEACGGQGSAAGCGGALVDEASVLVFASPSPTDVVNSHPSQAAGDIAWIDVASGGVRRPTRGAPAHRGIPSPTGPEVVWEETFVVPDPAKFRCGRRLHCVDADGEDAPLRSWQDNDWDAHPPRWSPDGARFAVVADGQVLVWSVADTHAPPVRLGPPDGASAEAGFLVWSAAGDWILVWLAGSLWRLP